MRRASTVALAALLGSAGVYTTGCGGDEPGNSAGDKESEGSPNRAVETTADGTRRCPPSPRPAQTSSRKEVGPRATLRVKLPKYKTTLALNVDGAHRAKEVGGTGGYAAQRGEFVVITYGVRNVGPAPVEAAVVNALFGVSTGGRVDYGPAEAASGCKASILFAKKATPAAKVAELDLAPGQGYRTIGAYVVPRPKRRVSWVASDGSYRVELVAKTD